MIVVGAGGSGLCCAAEAAARGAKVLVVEKAPKVGGTTSWAVGAYASNATPHQRRAGVDDDPGRHFADMDLVNAAGKRADNLGLRRLLTHGAPKTFVPGCLTLASRSLVPAPSRRTHGRACTRYRALLIYYLNRRLA